jgi:hypothetical protein
MGWLLEPDASLPATVCELIQLLLERAVARRQKFYLPLLAHERLIEVLQGGLEVGELYFDGVKAIGRGHEFAALWYILIPIAGVAKISRS